MRARDSGRDSRACARRAPRPELLGTRRGCGAPASHRRRSPRPIAGLSARATRRVGPIPRSVTQLIDVKAQLRPGQPLVGVGQAQVGEDVAGAFLVLDAPCPSPPASYSPLTLRYLRWLLFKTYLHSTRSAGAGLRIARSSRILRPVSATDH